jgi:predicted nucleotidyltransferase component of viral defense system
MLSLADIRAAYPPALQQASRFLLREYLQCKILEIIYGSNLAGKLFFIGGTCLRILHGNQRFSEDLDFDHTGISEVELDQLAQLLERELGLMGLSIEMRLIHRGAWHCYLRFPEILFQTGLSGHREEKILIQVDVEAQGYTFQPERRLLNQFDVFTAVLAPSLSLLLAQKITAILNRPRSKGRDFFDVTFLHARAKPDYGFLNQKTGIRTPEMLQEHLLAHCATLDFDEMARDVQPFLFHPRDANRVTLFPEFVRQAEW